VLASPTLIPSKLSQQPGGSPKIKNFLNHSDIQQTRHSNINLVKYENTDLKKSQEYSSLNLIAVDSSFHTYRPSKTFKPKILQHNTMANQDTRPANLSRSARALSSVKETYIPRPNGAIGRLAEKLQHHTLAASPVMNPAFNALAASNDLNSNTFSNFTKEKIPFDLNRKISLDCINATNISSSF